MHGPPLVMMLAHLPSDGAGGEDGVEVHDPPSVLLDDDTLGSERLLDPWEGRRLPRRDRLTRRHRALLP
jgi:hypothetical protein